VIRWIREKIEDWRYRRVLKRKRKEMQRAMANMTAAFNELKGAMAYLPIAVNKASNALKEMALAVQESERRQNHPFYLQDDHAGKDGKYKGEKKHD
jgi:hypothetical protein